MSGISRLPDNDPTKVFFGLEDDIHSIVDLVALVIHALSDASTIDADVENGVERVLGIVQDHALSIQSGFRQAFPPSKAG